MKCGICKEEIIPGKDKAVQIRSGYITTGEYQDFEPESDIEYCHLGCFDGVEFPSKED